MSNPASRNTGSACLVALAASLLPGTIQAQTTEKAPQTKTAAAPTADRDRNFYVSAHLGATHLDVGRLTGIAGDNGHASGGVDFGLRINPNIWLEAGHRRVTDGGNDYFEWGENTDLRLDSLHFGPVFDVLIGHSVVMSLSAGIQSWRYRFVYQNIPFIGANTRIERRDSGAGGYGRIGAVWKMAPGLEFGGQWSYLDIDGEGANALEARFNYRF